MDLLAATARAWDIPLSRRQLDQFATYAGELRSWNERVNLTAITDPAEIEARHFLDSLRCALSWGAPPSSLVDVGAGAGFPGLPLKILYPDLRLTLVDSVAKKARFLETVAAELGLSDVIVIADRAEALGQAAGHRESYDWAAARAVAELRVLAELLLPLCRVGGHMLAQKGDSAAAELAAAGPAIAAVGGGAARLTAIHLPEIEATHTLVVIDKAHPTAARYPRRVGVPSKKPL